MTSTSVAQLIDTNVLVYRVDARFPPNRKQRQTSSRIRSALAMSYPASGIAGILRWVTRPLPGVKTSLLTSNEARQEIETLLLTSIILYPVENDCG